MVVWVMIIHTWMTNAVGTSMQTTIVDNIASAESCEQLAKVVRKTNVANAEVTCAPVRKVRP